MLLTACEKGLVDGVADVAPAGQAAKSVLQVRTRSGGSAGGEATVAYPVTVYVFSGEECRAVQTIGDEGQTLNIGLTEGTYSVYAVGGASSSDYVLTDDEMPSNVAKLKFYYLGGSSTFSPKDGYGCVNSVNRDWAVTFILDVTNLC